MRINAGLAGLLLLVGHSDGGAMVRQYITLYPQRNTGILFVDTLHERKWVNAALAINANSSTIYDLCR